MAANNVQRTDILVQMPKNKFNSGTQSNLDNFVDSEAIRSPKADETASRHLFLEGSPPEEEIFKDFQDLSPLDQQNHRFVNSNTMQTQYLVNPAEQSSFYDGAYVEGETWRESPNLVKISLSQPVTFENLQSTYALIQKQKTMFQQVKVKEQVLQIPSTTRAQATALSNRNTPVEGTNDSEPPHEEKGYAPRYFKGSHKRSPPNFGYKKSLSNAIVASASPSQLKPEPNSTFVNQLMSSLQTRQIKQQAGDFGHRLANQSTNTRDLDNTDISMVYDKDDKGMRKTTPRRITQVFKPTSLKYHQRAKVVMQQSAPTDDSPAPHLQPHLQPQFKPAYEESLMSSKVKFFPRQLATPPKQVIRQEIKEQLKRSRRQPHNPLFVDDSEEETFRQDKATGSSKPLEEDKVQARVSKIDINFDSSSIQALKGSTDSLDGNKKGKMFGMATTRLSRYDKQIQYKQKQMRSSNKKIMKDQSVGKIYKDTSKSQISKPSGPSEEDRGSIDSPILKNQAISSNIRIVQGHHLKNDSLRLDTGDRTRNFPEEKGKTFLSTSSFGKLRMAGDSNSEDEYQPGIMKKTDSINYINLEIQNVPKSRAARLTHKPTSKILSLYLGQKAIKFSKLHLKTISQQKNISQFLKTAPILEMKSLSNKKLPHDPSNITLAANDDSSAKVYAQVKHYDFSLDLQKKVGTSTFLRQSSLKRHDRFGIEEEDASDLRDSFLAKRHRRETPRSRAVFDPKKTELASKGSQEEEQDQQLVSKLEANLTTSIEKQCQEEEEEMKESSQQTEINVPSPAPPKQSTINVSSLQEVELQINERNLSELVQYRSLEPQKSKAIRNTIIPKKKVNADLVYRSKYQEIIRHKYFASQEPQMTSPQKSNRGSPMKEHRSLVVSSGSPPPQVDLTEPSAFEKKKQEIVHDIKMKMKQLSRSLDFHMPSKGDVGDDNAHEETQSAFQDRTLKANHQVSKWTLGSKSGEPTFSPKAKISPQWTKKSINIQQRSQPSSPKKQRVGKEIQIDSENEPSYLKNLSGLDKRSSEVNQIFSKINSKKTSPAQSPHPIAKNSSARISASVMMIAHPTSNKDEARVGTQGKQFALNLQKDIKPTEPGKTPVQYSFQHKSIAQGSAFRSGQPSEALNSLQESNSGQQQPTEHMNVHLTENQPTTTQIGSPDAAALHPRPTPKELPFQIEGESKNLDDLVAKINLTYGEEKKEGESTAKFGKGRPSQSQSRALVNLPPGAISSLEQSTPTGGAEAFPASRNFRSSGKQAEISTEKKPTIMSPISGSPPSVPMALDQVGGDLSQDQTDQTGPISPPFDKSPLGFMLDNEESRKRLLLAAEPKIQELESVSIENLEELSKILQIPLEEVQYLEETNQLKRLNELWNREPKDFSLTKKEKRRMKKLDKVYNTRLKFPTIASSLATKVLNSPVSLPQAEPQQKTKSTIPSPGPMKKKTSVLNKPKASKPKVPSIIQQLNMDIINSEIDIPFREETTKMQDQETGVSPPQQSIDQFITSQKGISNSLHITPNKERESLVQPGANEISLRYQRPSQYPQVTVSNSNQCDSVQMTNKQETIPSHNYLSPRGLQSNQSKQESNQLSKSLSDRQREATIDEVIPEEALRAGDSSLEFGIKFQQNPSFLIGSFSSNTSNNQLPKIHSSLQVDSFSALKQNTRNLVGTSLNFQKVNTFLLGDGALQKKFGHTSFKPGSNLVSSSRITQGADDFRTSYLTNSQAGYETQFGNTFSPLNMAGSSMAFAQQTLDFDMSTDYRKREKFLNPKTLAKLMKQRQRLKASTALRKHSPDVEIPEEELTLASQFKTMKERHSKLSKDIQNKLAPKELSLSPKMSLFKSERISPVGGAAVKLPSLVNQSHAIKIGEFRDKFNCRAHQPTTVRMSSYFPEPKIILKKETQKLNLSTLSRNDDETSNIITALGTTQGPQIESGPFSQKASLKNLGAKQAESQASKQFLRDPRFRREQVESPLNIAIASEFRTMQNSPRKAMAKENSPRARKFKINSKLAARKKQLNEVLKRKIGHHESSMTAKEEHIAPFDNFGNLAAFSNIVSPQRMSSMISPLGLLPHAVKQSQKFQMQNPNFDLIQETPDSQGLLITESQIKSTINDIEGYNMESTMKERQHPHRAATKKSQKSSTQILQTNLVQNATIQSLQELHQNAEPPHAFGAHLKTEGHQFLQEDSHPTQDQPSPEKNGTQKETEGSPSIEPHNVVITHHRQSKELQVLRQASSQEKGQSSSPDKSVTNQTAQAEPGKTKTPRMIVGGKLSSSFQQDGQRETPNLNRKSRSNIFATGPQTNNVGVSLEITGSNESAVRGSRLSQHSKDEDEKQEEEQAGLGNLEVSKFSSFRSLIAQKHKLVKGGGKYTVSNSSVDKSRLGEANIRKHLEQLIITTSDPSLVPEEADVNDMRQANSLADSHIQEVDRKNTKKTLETQGVNSSVRKEGSRMSRYGAGTVLYRAADL